MPHLNVAALTDCGKARKSGRSNYGLDLSIEREIVRSLRPLVHTDKDASVIAVVIVIDGHVLGVFCSLNRHSVNSEVRAINWAVDATRSRNMGNCGVTHPRW